MAWNSIPGSGDLLLGTSDEFSAPVASISNLFANIATLSNLFANTASISDLNANNITKINRAAAAQPLQYLQLYRSSANIGAIGINSADDITVFRGTGTTEHTTFTDGGSVRIQNAATVPNSGDFLNAGELYIQSGALYFLGGLGQLTLVATSG